MKNPKLVKRFAIVQFLDAKPTDLPMINNFKTLRKAKKMLKLAMKKNSLREGVGYMIVPVMIVKMPKVKPAANDAEAPKSEAA